MSTDAALAGKDVLKKNLTSFSWGWDKAKKQHHLAVKGMIPWQTSLTIPPAFRNEYSAMKSAEARKALG